MKQHEDAVLLQLRLLLCPGKFIFTKLEIKHSDTQGFCCDTRGELWERIAINCESHLREPENALKHLQAGLVDPFVKDKHKVILQDRAIKLTKGQFKPVIVVVKPKEVSRFYFLGK